MEESKEIQQKLAIESIKNGVLRKFPLLGGVMATLTFEPNKDIRTAGTDGKRIVYSPEFIEKISYDERVFLFAHELMHNAFDHILRSRGRDQETWNKATDAVINQMLKNAQLPIPKGGIDMPEADGKSAEEMYEILQAKKQQDEENIPKEDDQQQEEQHDMWKDAVKQAEKEQQTSKPQPSEIPSMSSDDREKNFGEANEKLKKQIGQQIRDKLREQKEQMLESSKTQSGFISQFNGVGEAKKVISWKKILKRELEKEEDRWSYRRADEDNDYQARIGSLEVEGYPETEVMLDVSGSVDDDFLKGFLRQLKPLLKESKLRVGCFDEFVYDFVEIKSLKDIDCFKVTRKSTWTENWDGAVRAFSKKKGINKIVFTDGIPAPGIMPKNDLSKVDVIWLVFSNKKFNPCCGKVIFIDRKELKPMTAETEDFERMI